MTLQFRWMLMIAMSLSAIALPMTTSLTYAETYAGGIYKQVVIQDNNDYAGRVYGQDGDYQTPYDAGVSQNNTGKGVIGVNFLIKANVEPVVQGVYQGTPAYHAGIQPGDRIVMINDMPTRGWSKEEVDYAISDKPGDTVTFLIDRYGKLTMRAVVVQSMTSISSLR